MGGWGSVSARVPVLLLVLVCLPLRVPVAGGGARGVRGKVR